MTFFFNLCGRSKKDVNAVAPRGTYRLSSPDTPLSVNLTPTSSAAVQEIAGTARSASLAQPPPTRSLTPLAPAPAIPTMDELMAKQRGQKPAASVPPLAQPHRAATPDSHSVASPLLATPRASVAKASSPDSASRREYEQAFGRAQAPSMTSRTDPVPVAAAKPLATGSSTPAASASSLTAVPTAAALPPTALQRASAPAVLRSGTPTCGAAPSAVSRPDATALQMRQMPVVDSAVVRTSSTTRTVMTATTGVQTPQRPSLAPAALSTPSPRATQTATPTQLATAARPLTSTLYPMPGDAPFATKSTSVSPLKQATADVLQPQPTPLATNVDTRSGSRTNSGTWAEAGSSPVSASVATARAVPTIGTSGGTQARVSTSQPAITQAQTTASVTTLAQGPQSVRATSVPVARLSPVSAPRGASHEQVSAVPRTATGVVGNQSSVQPATVTSRVDSQSTRLPEVQQLGKGTALHTTTTSSHAPRVSEACPGEAGDAPAAVQWGTMPRTGVLPSGYTTVAPNSPRTSGTAMTPMMPRPPVSPGATRQHGTATVEVRNVASTAMRSENLPREDITASLGESSFSHSPPASVFSGVSQDVWIDADSQTTSQACGQRLSRQNLPPLSPKASPAASPSTNASRRASSGTPATLEGPPSTGSRPGTAVFVDGARPGRVGDSHSQIAPRGVQLTQGNSPLYNGLQNSAVDSRKRSPLPDVSSPPRTLVTSADVSAFSHSTTEREEVLSLTSPPRASVATMSPNDGDFTPPIMRLPPATHRPNGLAINSHLARCGLP